MLIDPAKSESLKEITRKIRVILSLLTMGCISRSN